MALAKSKKFNKPHSLWHRLEAGTQIEQTVGEQKGVFYFEKNISFTSHCTPSGNIWLHYDRKDEAARRTAFCSISNVTCRHTSRHEPDGLIVHHSADYRLN